MGKENKSSLLIMGQTSSGYQILSRQYKGKKCIVVPVVMMVEGVHAGSYGPMLHKAEELGKFPASWDGMPVVIDHPQDENGNYVSANDLRVVESHVGRVFSTKMDGTKLKANAWLDEDRLQEMSVTAFEHIMQGDPLEVSIGVFTEEVSSPGVWNGEEYEKIAVNHRPDHLALLPENVGACSWEDGCGVRVNNKSETKNERKNGMKINVREAAKLLATSGSLMTNAQGYQETISQIQSILNAKDTKDEWYYLEEVFPAHVIYVRSGETVGRKLYQQGYSHTNNGVELIAEPVEVRKDVNYLPLQANEVNMRVNLKQEEKKMKTTEKSPCFLAKVEGIIGNAASKFGKEDETWLMEQSEETLDKLLPKTSPEVHSTKTVETEAVNVFKAGIKTFEDVLKVAPEELKTPIEAGLKLHNEKREALIKTIQANSAEGVWDDETLAEMELPMLEKIGSMATGTVYSAATGGATPAVNQNQEAPLLPPGVNIETK